MGRSDAKAFIDTYRPVNEIAKLASGLVHMAHAGLASVEVLADTIAKQDDTFFFHYTCPSTFETEVLRDHGRRSIRCACFYSAGYAAGWCTEALNMHLHVREMVCKARGDDRCEFIMAPRPKLDDHYRRLRGGAEPGRDRPQKLRVTDGARLGHSAEELLHLLALGPDRERGRAVERVEIARRQRDARREGLFVERGGEPEGRVAIGLAALRGIRRTRAPRPRATEGRP
jgi:hypothetical protein